ncbi:BZ3500_MvSof-1268-A1-R1_Chr4-2g07029 [Microbotryum saponariae]|uniref:BZ3500_MvSof-1268-A1-R1_Chr4-2g07029 protein n=1 Tax=Microbotryum saponariae TaxID=289078 RepID=A0A2X0KST5_9BASI|nr:BZ3500_MvSof-1268-A1-R1_Chr4-2g07029 [Microbotryum saponariae]SDA06694.1 BZ3501_MvSof-1269-A2-R1_Chr4-2g06740 [Microbotryum saponariae]
MTRARLLDDVQADLTTRTRELGTHAREFGHARPCFAFTVLILTRKRCMRLSDFGLINHRWHKNDRHNKYAGCDAIIRCAGAQ